VDASAALGRLDPLPRPEALAALSVIPAEAVALRLDVIGSMRVRRGQLPLAAVGGPKAGANQALGLFAFLFDRDIRGVDKDEAIELIWPESPLPVADTAFHRTVLGLRRTLGASDGADVVDYRAGRYFLAEGVVASSDLSDLEDLLDASATMDDPAARIALLEQCRVLNRGAYMDDCPFYGTSVFVEVRRSLVHSVMTAVLFELGDLYEATDHPALAAMRRGEVGLLGDGPPTGPEGGRETTSPLLRRGRP
jgi:DNA-binding SARP family transcriptional activator